MKKIISVIIIFTLLIYMLASPERTISAAANGLLLWYETILPTLLPFAILSYIFLASNCFYLFARFLYPIMHFFLPVSREGTFPITAGFLFGFPMGSRISATMLCDNKLSRKEASVIYLISNNMSPMFISGYILEKSLHLSRLAVPTFLALFLPPLILCKILLSRHLPSSDYRQNNTTPRFQLNFKIIDAAIMNGFETLTKLGGYIMFFSIVASMIDLLPIQSCIIKYSMIGAIEITNGIQCVCASSLDQMLQYLLCIAFTAFGGLSGVAQTSSMISESELPILPYFLTKLLLCILSCVIATIFYIIW